MLNNDYVEDSLSLYIRDIASSEPLSREEESKLSCRIQLGDKVARNKLVSANLRFSFEIAKSSFLILIFLFLLTLL